MKRKVLMLLPLLMLGLLTLAQAVPLTYFKTGSFDNGLNSNRALVRIGDQTGAGTWEYGLFTEESTSTPVAQGQFAWGKGQPINFTLDFKKDSGMTFTLGSGPGNLSYAFPKYQGGLDDLFFATKIASGTTYDASMNGLAITIDGVTTPLIGDLQSSQSGNQLDTAYLTGINFKDFTLTGSILFDWTGAPTPNGLQAIIGFGPPNCVVPEPATLALLGLGLGGVVSLRRRFSRKA